jgi:dihydrodipicolinate synthase/N-acetylneuraminate lyase
MTSLNGIWLPLITPFRDDRLDEVSLRRMIRHYAAAAVDGFADATTRPILIYNIPYRSGVNLCNDTMPRLAERGNIVGVKDCCADATQSFDLSRARPPEFAVLTGEDALFYTALTQGPMAASWRRPISRPDPLPRSATCCCAAANKLRWLHGNN